MALREYYLTFESTQIRFLESGSGFPVLLLHGSGPGVSVEGNYRYVLDELTARYHVIGMDWIGFGKSGRRSAQPFFDVGLWERQVQFALQQIPGSAVGILAHSLAAVFALTAAAVNQRVVKVLTTGAMGTRFKLNNYLERVWSFPRTRDDVRQTLECLVYDRTLITDEFVDSRYKMLQIGDYGDYFSSMFSGDKQRYIDASAVPESILQSIDSDVIMMHGRDDLPIPADETTMMLGKSIRNADIWIVSNCGHSPALEHPEKVLTAVRLLFG